MGGLCTTKRKKVDVLDGTVIPIISNKNTNDFSYANKGHEVSMEEENPIENSEIVKILMDPSTLEILKRGISLSTYIEGKYSVQTASFEILIETIEYICYRSSFLLQLIVNHKSEIPYTVVQKCERFILLIIENIKKNSVCNYKSNLEKTLLLSLEFYFFLLFNEEESESSFLSIRWWHPLTDDEYINSLLFMVYDISNNNTPVNFKKNHPPSNLTIRERPENDEESIVRSHKTLHGDSRSFRMPLKTNNSDSMRNFTDIKEKMSNRIYKEDEIFQNRELSSEDYEKLPSIDETSKFNSLNDTNRLQSQQSSLKFGQKVSLANTFGRHYKNSIESPSNFQKTPKSNFKTKKKSSSGYIPKIKSKKEFKSDNELKEEVGTVTITKKNTFFDSEKKEEIYDFVRNEILNKFVFDKIF